MLAMTGVVFNIQRFSLHDGPGIRTTVFLKGCSMSCFWCHNPEGRHPKPEIFYHADKCITCGECVTVCPNHAHTLVDETHTFLRHRCTVAGECVEVCCSGALELAGEVMTVDEVMEEVLRDRPFYERSGGGITLSGGEPALKSAFSLALLARSKEHGLHTAIETCGNCHWEDLESLLAVTDLVMMDIKLMTEKDHKKATGNSNRRILDNARRLAGTRTPILFRTPIVPGINDSAEEFERIVAFVRSLVDLRATNGTWTAHDTGIQYELLPFHKMAADKYRNLGLEYRASDIDPPSRSDMDRLAAIAEKHGVTAMVR
jgi:pyruvate formate lyase activating enzyme